VEQLSPTISLIAVRFETWTGTLELVLVPFPRARCYDPQTTQFLTRDPLNPLNPLTRSAYSYVGGNPLNTSDPSGAGAECLLAAPAGPEMLVAACGLDKGGEVLPAAGSLIDGIFAASNGPDTHSGNAPAEAAQAPGLPTAPQVQQATGADQPAELTPDEVNQATGACTGQPKLIGPDGQPLPDPIDPWTETQAGRGDEQQIRDRIAKGRHSAPTRGSEIMKGVAGVLHPPGAP
jgi:RHS repeat-associated protein